MNKKEIVLRDKSMKLKVYKNHMEFTKDGSYFVIAYKFISNLYLINQADISLKDLLKLATSVPLYFIDYNGYILAKIVTDV